MSGVARASDRRIEDAVVLRIRPAGATETLCARVPTSIFRHRRHPLRLIRRGVLSAKAPATPQL